MKRRVVQLVWIVDHVADLNADFRAFYHMSWAEAVRSMDGPELLTLATRTIYFPGVMRARVQAEAALQEAANRRATGGREVANRVDSGNLATSTMADLFD